MQFLKCYIKGNEHLETLLQEVKEESIQKPRTTLRDQLTKRRLDLLKNNKRNSRQIHLSEKKQNKTNQMVSTCYFSESSQYLKARELFKKSVDSISLKLLHDLCKIKKPSKGRFRLAKYFCIVIDAFRSKQDRILFKHEVSCKL